MAFFNRSRPHVKPIRVSRRPNRPFADGLFPDRSIRTAPYTSADSAWWAKFSNLGTTRYDVLVPSPAPIRGGAPEPDYDWMACESAAQDCLDRGLIPMDLAEYIARTSLVGHPA